MYIEQITISNLRVFADAAATFQFPRRESKNGERKLEHPNLNLILGDNGAGKSSLLKAVALTVLGPLAEKFSPYMLVRRKKEASKPRARVPRPKEVFGDDRAIVTAGLQCTWQDLSKKKPVPELETLPWSINV